MDGEELGMGQPRRTRHSIIVANETSAIPFTIIMPLTYPECHQDAQDERILVFCALRTQSSIRRIHASDGSSEQAWYPTVSGLGTWPAGTTRTTP